MPARKSKLMKEDEELPEPESLEDPFDDDGEDEGIY